MINSQARQTKKKCTHRDRSQTFQYGARDSGQSDLRFPTLKQVKLHELWVLEVTVFGVRAEQELRSIKKNYLWSNEPATSLPRQTG